MEYKEVVSVGQYGSQSRFTTIDDKPLLSVWYSNANAFYVKVFAEVLLKDLPDDTVFPEELKLHLWLTRNEVDISDRDAVLRKIVEMCHYSLSKSEHEAVYNFMKNTVFDSYEKVSMIASIRVAICCGFDTELTTAYQKVIIEHPSMLPLRYLQLEVMARLGTLDPNLTIGEQVIEVPETPAPVMSSILPHFKLSSPKIRKRIDAMSVDEFSKIVSMKKRDLMPISSTVSVMLSQIDTILSGMNSVTNSFGVVMSEVLNLIENRQIECSDNRLLKIMNRIGSIVQGRPSVGQVFLTTMRMYAFDYATLNEVIVHYKSQNWFKGTKNELEFITNILLAKVPPTTLGDMYRVAIQEEKSFTATAWKRVADRWDDYEDLPADWIVSCL